LENKVMSNKWLGLLLAVACALPMAAQRRGDQQRPSTDPTPAQATTGDQRHSAEQRASAEQITNGPVVESTGDTWAVIAWTTNTGGSSVVKFGTDQRRLDQTAQAPYADNEKTSAQNHRVRLQNLRPGTQYFFLVDSAQGEGTGTEARSSVGQFTTKGRGGAGNGERGERHEAAVRIIDGPRVEAVGNDWAVIAWTTNSASSSVIRYGFDRGRLDQMSESPYADNDKTANQTHRVRLKNLRPNSTYYFAVDSGQGEGTGTEARSQISEFRTK
jgi:hypothetical protein